jgi:hypothetical protein
LEVGGKVLKIKPKGTRYWYTVPYEEIFRMGLRIRAQEFKAAKLAAKKGK